MRLTCPCGTDLKVPATHKYGTLRLCPPCLREAKEWEFRAAEKWAAWSGPRDVEEKDVERV
jgi:hypothetical protein